MNFYLSSYKIGNEEEKLKEMTKNKKIGFIPNALDYVNVEERKISNEKNVKCLLDIGVDVETLDLEKYFGKKKELEDKINNLDGVWIRGGNTFILRQAMKLSGFDDIIKRKNEKNEDFFYGGYSAGVCILAPSMEALKMVDDPKIMPYSEIKETIFEGLNILDYVIIPHYKSDHPESFKIDEVVDFCEKNKTPFKTLRDGEVIII